VLDKLMLEYPVMRKFGTPRDEESRNYEESVGVPLRFDCKPCSCRSATVYHPGTI
jgi:hypothetical protein